MNGGVPAEDRQSRNDSREKRAAEHHSGAGGAAKEPNG
ncbi:hypothetical protein LEP1GSC058_0858 [Leptospira fainei serovar Hurstbridge str. BUT 6]|uniref:Uncharacterized protein n=1 Tax=Leptospira fainei serovar Hurstbridge str. BUT 6 TaxID=1193011 RepID=S3UW41_9LEPT|nr:hypothetical protein LEP1GSC058_0858 [Leptospira fainei serovar Hurstbridge str. BUT 6]